jgi:hypothetical protein
MIDLNGNTRADVAIPHRLGLMGIAAWGASPVKPD